MKKIKTKYVCSNCGAEFIQWMGRCPNCGEWNTLEEQADVPSPVKSALHKGEVPRSIDDVHLDSGERMKIGISEIDRPLGGGIVKGSVILWGGEPGIGKSTLILQLCSGLAKQGKKVLYCSGEESEEQIKLRADRMNVHDRHLYVLSESSIENIIAQAESLKPSLLVIDSIQTMTVEGSGSAAGSPAQIRDCTAMLVHLAKTCNIAVMIIGHVTKEGNLAGPRLLEHMVDVVFYLEGDRNYQFRILRTVKNRFGSTAETGLFVMEEKGLKGIADPSKYMLKDRASSVPGSIVACCLEGLRPVLVEIQALTVHSVLAMPRRIASGFDYNRLIILLAVLEKRAHFRFSQDDVYINIAGGIKVKETAIDLAAAVALISVKKDIPVSNRMTALGEVGLTGEILPVSHIDLRFKEAVKMNFTEFMVPYRNKTEMEQCLSKLNDPSKIHIVYLKSIQDITNYL